MGGLYIEQKEIRKQHYQNQNNYLEDSRKTETFCHLDFSENYQILLVWKSRKEKQ